jgi:hypothetical protein
LSAKRTSPEPGPFGSLECGCTISKDWGFLGIEYCATHAAAPDLLEALEAALPHLSGVNWANRGNNLFTQARAALAKARSGRVLDTAIEALDRASKAAKP